MPTYTQHELSKNLNTRVPVAQGVLAEAAHLWAQVVVGIFLDAYSGIMWLYPSAVSAPGYVRRSPQGGVLIFAVVCSILRGPINGVSSYVLHGLQLTTGLVLCSLAALTKGTSVSRAVASADLIPNVTWPNADQALQIGDISNTILSFTDGARLLNRLVDGNRAIPVLVAVYTGLTVITWVSR